MKLTLFPEYVYVSEIAKHLTFDIWLAFDLTLPFFFCYRRHIADRAPLSFVGNRALATQERWRVNLLFVPFVAHLFTPVAFGESSFSAPMHVQTARERKRENADTREQSEREEAALSGNRTDLSTGCYLVTRRGLRLYDSPAWMMLSPMVSVLSRHGRALTCR